MTTINMDQLNTDLDTILNDIEKIRININKFKLEYNDKIRLLNDTKIVQFKNNNAELDNFIQDIITNERLNTCNPETSDNNSNNFDKLMPQNGDSSFILRRKYAKLIRELYDKSNKV